MPSCPQENSYNLWLATCLYEKAYIYLDLEFVMDLAYIWTRTVFFTLTTQVNNNNHRYDLYSLHQVHPGIYTLSWHFENRNLVLSQEKD